MVNKTDLAPHVGVNAVQMKADAVAARGGGPAVAVSRSDEASVGVLLDWVGQDVVQP